VRLIRAALGDGMLFATQTSGVARTVHTRFFKEQNYDNENESQYRNRMHSTLVHDASCGKCAIARHWWKRSHWDQQWHFNVE
jgi:hypothetical protein